MYPTPSRTLSRPLCRAGLPAPGQIVKQAGRRWHVCTQGHGVPVLFEAGAGGWSSHWARVLAILPRSLRAYAYDRRGLGWSPPASGTRSTAVLAGELQALLDGLRIDAPALFVAHSYGASIVRLLAQQAPERVRGIVFVDGWHEACAGPDERTTGGLLERAASAALGLAGCSGVLALLARIWPSGRPPSGLSPGLWRSMHRLSLAGLAAALAEARDMAQDDALLRPQLPAGMPLLALVARHTVNREAAPRGFDVEAHNLAWAAGSRQLAELNDHGRVDWVEDSDHLIPLWQPERVVTAVQDLLAASG